MNNSLEWKDICLEVPELRSNKRKQILHNISCKADPGRMVALMGSSGCGKTSLLKILSGRVPNEFYTSGTVYYHGKERDNSFIDKVSFLEQENDYSEYFDTYSFLKFNLECLKDEPAFEIDYLIDMLKLSKTKFTKLVKLSGGERKRVIVANELLTNKKIIFLDEPTTGLDSHLALEMILFLSRVVKERNLILIVSIHQPSSTILNLFDDFLFMNEGKFIYSGKMADCKKFFEERGMILPSFITFPEFLFELASDSSPFDDINKIKPYFNKLIPNDSNSVQNSLSSSNKTELGMSFKRIKSLFKRQAKIFNYQKNRSKFLLALFSTFIISFFIILVYKNPPPTDMFIKKFKVSEDLIKIFLNVVEKKKLASFLTIFLFISFNLIMTTSNISLYEYKVNKEEIKRGLYSFTELVFVSFTLNLVINYLLFLIISYSLYTFVSKNYDFFFKNAYLLPLFIQTRTYFIISLFEAEILYSLTNSLFLFLNHLDKIILILKIDRKKEIFTYFSRAIKLFPENLLIKYMTTDLDKYLLSQPNNIKNFFNNNLEKFDIMPEDDSFFDFDRNKNVLFGISGMIQVFMCFFMVLFFRNKYSRNVRMRLNKHK